MALELCKKTEALSPKNMRLRFQNMVMDENASVLDQQDIINIDLICDACRKNRC